MNRYEKKLMRIREALSCNEPDRVPVFELFWDSFVKKWRKEKGLPEDADIYKFYDMDLVIAVPKADPKLKSFEIIEKTKDYIIFKSGYGCTVKKVYSAPMPQFVDYSIKSADNYEKFELEDPLDDSRYFSEFCSITANAGDVLVNSFEDQIKKYKGTFISLREERNVDDISSLDYVEELYYGQKK